MPIKKISALILFGFLVGGLGNAFYQNFVPRQPASVLPPPKLRLKPWSESLVGKAHAAMSVKISVVGGMPEHDNQELRLKAEVTLNRPVDQEVKFQWSLPADASLVSGNLEDSWANLQPGQTATTEITVLNVSKESISKTVTLHVSGTANGVQYAGAGSFATNSLEQMKLAEENEASGSRVQDLALKKSSSAAKLEKVQQ
jgi:hypothetical protein